MITVTEDAKVILEGIIEKVLEKVHEPAIDRDKVALRLIVQEDGLGLGIDLPREGDQVIEQNGHPVLVVDPGTGLMLDGATVGTEETSEGKKLTVTRQADNGK